MVPPNRAAVTRIVNKPPLTVDTDLVDNVRTSPMATSGAPQDGPDGHEAVVVDRDLRRRVGVHRGMPHKVREHLGQRPARGTQGGGGLLREREAPPSVPSLSRSQDGWEEGLALAAGAIAVRGAQRCQGWRPGRPGGKRDGLTTDPGGRGRSRRPSSRRWSALFLELLLRQRGC